MKIISFFFFKPLESENNLPGRTLWSDTFLMHIQCAPKTLSPICHGTWRTCLENYEVHLNYSSLTRSLFIARKQLHAFSFLWIMIYPFWHYFQMPLTIYTGNRCIVFVMTANIPDHQQQEWLTHWSLRSCIEFIIIYSLKLPWSLWADTLPQAEVGMLNVLVTRTSTLCTTWVLGKWISDLCLISIMARLVGPTHTASVHRVWENMLTFKSPFR